VSKSYLYVAGAFIGESEKTDFDMAAPVTEVSSGNITIEAVGVGKDGSLYPPESIHINLKNVYTDSAAASSRKYKDLQGVIAQIGAIDQEIEYWYTRACNEPDFVTFTSGKEIVSYDGFYRVASTPRITLVVLLIVALIGGVIVRTIYVRNAREDRRIAQAERDQKLAGEYILLDQELLHYSDLFHDYQGIYIQFQADIQRDTDRIMHRKEEIVTIVGREKIAYLIRQH
jgi:hypothetical protein